MKDTVIAGFGEVMLRLCPPGRNRFAQALPGQLDATFGGGEANVCASLALLGAKSRYLTALPENPVSGAFAAQMRGIGVDVDHILYRPGRMGVYYAEHGAAQRGSSVVYDREHSVISECGPGAYDFDSMLAGCGHLHVTGITPAVSEAAFEATLAAVTTAKRLGLTVSCDLNFRKKLWRWRPGTAPGVLAGECMARVVAAADIIIGNEEDASDVFGIAAANSAVESGRLDRRGYVEVAGRLAERFPQARLVAITLRESYSADHNNWGGLLYDCGSGTAHFAPVAADGSYAPYEIRDIVDRFGGGDSFCAGLLYALNSEQYRDPALAIRFAVAASCLKHTVKGDFNYVTAAEVESLLTGGGSGRVRR